MTHAKAGAIRASITASGTASPTGSGAASRALSGAWLGLICALAIAWPAAAAADPVTVRVIDIAGGAVYLSPGRAAGIIPGTRVRLRGAEATVVEVTEKTAMVRLAGDRVAIGDSGTADVTPGAAPAARPLPRPRPPEAFVGQWSDPVLPASQQQVVPAPLGAAAAGRARIAVIGHGYGAIDRAHREGDAETRVIASFDVVAGRPFAADLDVAGRWFSSGFDRRTHTPLVVRAAQLRYGSADDPRLAVSRLRFAATSVGMLDGGRASARICALEVAAFGGLVPDPLSGKPDTAVSRFGTELSYDAPDAAWQPRISVAAHGSTWNGRLDERRLSIAASGDRDALRLDGWAEIEAFAADNPWGARGVELTGAGATAQWRRHGAHAGLDVTFLRPERSLRLAAALPPEWLCTLVPAAPSTETCASTWWGAATASAGLGNARWAVDGGATLGDSHGEYRGLDRSGYLRGELRLGPSRLGAALSAGQASFASWTAAEIDAAYAPSRTVDLALGYRPELLDHVAGTGPELLHTVLADARLALSAALDLAVSASGTTGRDRDTLALLITFAWRPSP